MAITVVRSLPSTFAPSLAIRLVGFGREVSFANEKTSALADQALSILSRYSSIVWDGDSHASTSFTHLIVLLAQQLKAKAEGRQMPRLFSFIKASSERRFITNWASLADRLSLDITLVLGPNNVPWDELALHTMRECRVKTVLAFGGGQAVTGEAEKTKKKVVKLVTAAEVETLGTMTAGAGASDDPTVTFWVLPVSRVVAGTLEECGLLGFL